MKRDGYVKVAFSDGGAVSLALNEYDAVLTAWREGERYYEGRDPYGDLVTFHMDGIRFVAKNTAAGIVKSIEEDKLDKLEGVE